MQQKEPLIGWLIAGIPIAISALQGLSAILLNTSLQWIPGVGIFSGIYTAPVVIEASRLFYSQPGLVSALFVMIVLTWIAHGGFLFSRLQTESYARTGAAGTVGLTGVLYFFLFVGVYFPLFSSGVPVLQLGAFFLIPVAATGALAYSYLSYDWLSTRRANAVERIKQARRTTKRKRSRFEDRIDDTVFKTLEPTATPALDRARSLRDDFVEECEDITDDCTSAVSSAEWKDIGRLEDTAATVERRASTLSPDEEASEVESILQDTIEDAIRDRFGSLDDILRTIETGDDPLESPYGERYRIENLPAAYRQVELPFEDETVTLSSQSGGNVADQLTALFNEDGRAAGDFEKAADAVETHIRDTLLPYIRQQEAEFQDIETATTSKLERAEELIDDVDGYVGQMLQRVFVEATHAETTDTIADVRELLSDARGDLHGCDFDAAIDDAESAREMAEDLLEALQFLRSVFLPDIESGVEEIEVRTLLPDVREHDFITVELFEALADALRHDHAADIDIDADAGVVSVTYLSLEEVETTPPTRKDVDSEGGPKDSVLFLLRELENREEDDRDVVTIQLASIPEGIIRRGTVPELVEFAENSSKVEVETEQTPDESPPSEGYVSLRVTDGSRPSMAVRELRDEYRNWAGKATLD